MGQQSNTPRFPSNTASALGNRLRTSQRKLNLVVRLIRGKSSQEALDVLTFCTRRISKDVKKVLLAAITNAQNNFNLDVDRLYVSEATTGKSLMMRRYRARARGRGARIHKPFSQLRIILREL